MPRIKHTKERLAAVVAEATSMAQVLDALGLRQAGGNYMHIKRRIALYGLDTSHFLGYGHARGKRFPWQKRTWQSYLVKRSTGHREHGHLLRRALIASDREYVCELCGVGPEWQSRPLTLEIDHINHDWLDDRAENLRFLCPNCHSQE
jgi:hypothetical protein